MLQNQMKRVEAALRRTLRGKDSAQRRVSIPRACKGRTNANQRVEDLTPVDFRHMYDREPLVVTKRNFEVEVGKSEIAGDGLFVKMYAPKGRTVHSCTLPSSEFSESFRKEQYSCLRHVMHRDQRGVVHIDPARFMRGNLMACLTDMQSMMFRLLNHSTSPNAELQFSAENAPEWFEATKAGEIISQQWYSCSIVTTKPVRAGQELTIRYRSVPKEWENGSRNVTRGGKRKR